MSRQVVYSANVLLGHVRKIAKALTDIGRDAVVDSQVVMTAPRAERAQLAWAAFADIWDAVYEQLLDLQDALGVAGE